LTAGTVLALIVAATIAAAVIAPLLREGSSAAPHDDFATARDLQSKQDMLLASLKDLEDDHATDKVSEEDYNELRSRLSAEAVEVMRALDADEQRRVAEATSGTLRHPGARRPGHSR